MLVDRDRVRIDRVVDVRDVLGSATRWRLEACAILAGTGEASSARSCLLTRERAVLVDLTRLIEFIELLS